MDRRLKIMLAAGWLAAAATPSVAQVAPGSRVRVTLSKSDSMSLAKKVGPGEPLRRDLENSRRVTGTLVSIESETLEVRVEGLANPLVLPRSTLERVDVGRGPGSRGKTAGIGALVGLGVGAVTFFVVEADKGCPADPSGATCFDFGPTAGEGAAFVGILGALGAGIGAVLPRGERWEPVALDGLKVSLAATNGRGVSVALRIDF